MCMNDLDYEISCAKEVYKAAINYDNEIQEDYFVSVDYLSSRNKHCNPDKYMLENEHYNAKLDHAQMVVNYAESLFR